MCTCAHVRRDYGQELKVYHARALSFRIPRVYIFTSDKREIEREKERERGREEKSNAKREEPTEGFPRVVTIYRTNADVID